MADARFDLTSHQYHWQVFPISTILVDTCEDPYEFHRYLHHYEVLNVVGFGDKDGKTAQYMTCRFRYSRFCILSPLLTHDTLPERDLFL